MAKTILKEDIGTNVKFKVGDKVKVIEWIGVRDVEVGDIAVIDSIGKDNYEIVMDKNGKYWVAQDEYLELVVEENKVSTLDDFKVGDIVKVVKADNDFYDIEVGDRGVIDSIKYERIWIRFDKFPCKTQVISGHFDRIEIIETPKVEEIEEKFKVGDYIYYNGKYGFNFCKITEINNDELKGFWLRRLSIKTLPKTVSEFEKISFNKYDGFMFTKDVKKLLLIDDTELKADGKEVVELKANKELWDKFLGNNFRVSCKTEEEANEFLKYCEKQELIWCSGRKATSENYFLTGKTNTYETTGKGLRHLNYSKADITFEELFTEPKSEILLGVTLEDEIAPTTPYEIGQKLETIEDVKNFIKAGGKVEDPDGWKYYEKKGVLRYKELDGTKRESGGYTCISLPVTIHKLPKIKSDN